MFEVHTIKSLWKANTKAAEWGGKRGRKASGRVRMSVELFIKFMYPQLMTFLSRAGHTQTNILELEELHIHPAVVGSLPAVVVGSLPAVVDSLLAVADDSLPVVAGELHSPVAVLAADSRPAADHRLVGAGRSPAEVGHSLAAADRTGLVEHRTGHQGGRHWPSHLCGRMRNRWRQGGA